MQHRDVTGEVPLTPDLLHRDLELYLFFVGVFHPLHEDGPTRSSVDPQTITDTLTSEQYQDYFKRKILPLYTRADLREMLDAITEGHKLVMREYAQRR